MPLDGVKCNILSYNYTVAPFENNILWNQNQILKKLGTWSAYIERATT